ncbi:hypothetical protein SAMD00019534_073080 [Acytostelium subglobosum LB1]|uniref:hypothetical protein n=1 Tax=Acytostelium subglobosum LB1 TaxID=1410327 RepID=UPI0006450147|nr:hypothetical protein SAMD00019534_073080 [Acytostelium subglobosum LB1]GAM24133.1 hypothetical protein SAMD00019534_073080 [Acytostelium subglobosum LB1]|eukprot:XP_012753169.1 hypothetical protein SAMD00019534_073080 [Acytostelium subglobosum LB1]
MSTCLRNTDKPGVCVPPFSLKYGDVCDIKDWYSCDVSQDLECTDYKCNRIFRPTNTEEDCNDVRRPLNRCRFGSVCVCQTKDLLSDELSLNVNGRCHSKFNISTIPQILRDFQNCFIKSGCPRNDGQNPNTCASLACGKWYSEYNGGASNPCPSPQVPIYPIPSFI